MAKVKYADYIELPEVYKVVASAFNKKVTYFRKFVEMNPFYRGDDFFIAKENGKIVAAVQVLFREVYFNKERMLVGGIGQVSTLPGYRGRGLSGRLLTAALEYMKKNKVDYSLLFAGPVPLYKKYGWKELPVHFISSKVHNLSVPKVSDKYKIKKYIKNINYSLFDLHNKYIKNFNNCVIRNTVYWETYHNKFKAENSDIFLLEDKNKKLVAYLSVSKDDRKLTIMEYGSIEISNEEYFKILFSYVLNRSRVKEVFISSGNNFYIPYYVLKKEYNGNVGERSGFMVQDINSRIDWQKSMRKLMFFEHDYF